MANRDEGFEGGNATGAPIHRPDVTSAARGGRPRVGGHVHVRAPRLRSRQRPGHRKCPQTVIGGKAKPLQKMPRTLLRCKCDRPTNVTARIDLDFSALPERSSPV